MVNFEVIPAVELESTELVEELAIPQSRVASLVLETELPASSLSVRTVNPDLFNPRLEIKSQVGADFVVDLTVAAVAW